MRCLVTGGAGFIGSHLADRLLQDGHEVTLLDSLAPRVHRGGHPPHLPCDARLIVGDVRDPRALMRSLEGVEVVFHQAAYQDYLQDFSTFLTVNAGSTALLYELIVGKRLPVSKVIVASSQAVYGEGQYECAEHGLQQPPAREQEHLKAGIWEIGCPSCRRAMQPLLLREEYSNPYNAYGLSKLSEEMVALRLGRLYGIPSVALRYSITQGPRQSPFNAYSGICRIFSQRIAHGEPPVVFEDGLQTRDFVHVHDVVEANIVVMRDNRANGMALNVGSGRATTVLEYAHGILAAFGSQLRPVISGEYRVGDNRHSVSGIERLQQLGWTPRQGLSEVFSDYIAWLRAQAECGDHFAEADVTMRHLGVVCRVEH